ncbi:MAG TPA: hypothetical protein P5511_01315 [Candidatus Goldiibacteriota bacterium]|nr:hypothetical protein [Candidatus Goldiibacteriota bacterium]
MRGALIITLVAVLLLAACATANQGVKKELRPTGLQTAAGAVIVISAMAGGAYEAASVSGNSGAGGILYGIAGGFGAAALAGGLYWVLLEAFAEKKDVLENEDSIKSDDGLLLPNN